jgi:hypothetical protein
MQEVDNKRKELQKAAQDLTHCKKALRQIKLTNVAKANLATGLTRIFTFTPGGLSRHFHPCTLHRVLRDHQLFKV